MTHKTTLSTLAVIFGIGLLATAGWFWSQRGATDGLAPSDIATGAPLDGAAGAASASLPPAVMASAPPALFPVESAASDAVLTAGGFDFSVALSRLLGSQAVEKFIQVGDFPRRFVATVDNLGRAQAPPSLWPIQPTPGRFLIDERDGKVFINSTNTERYDAVVAFVDGIDLRQAVKLYSQVYPLLQQAYQDIGYPKRYFNDRFVEVIDQLLATPEPNAPLQVHLTEVKGPLVSTRPWLRYEFVDPGYERLSSGQKIVLRMGPEHRRKLKARLIELRRELTKAPGPR